MTVRGGGDPVDSMAYHAVTENGSAASELRTDAHDCIMVRVLGPTEYKVVAFDGAAVLGTVNAKPCGWPPKRRPALTAPRRLPVGDEETAFQIEQRN
jgi:hypothetical protein